MRKITVGRNPQSNIVVSSDYVTVSGNHATISYDGQVYIIQDHSTNGTYVNGTKINNAVCQIRQGDNITLGTKYVLNLNEVISLLSGGATTERIVKNPEPIKPVITPQPVAEPEKSKNEVKEPECLNKWNWGAFCFSWIWAVCNGIYWPLIMLIPYLGQIIGLVISIILGINGNRYAWEQYKGNANDFDERQKSWSKAAGIYFLIVVVLSIIYAIAIVNS